MINPGGAQAKLFAVQRLHRGGGQLAPAHLRGGAEPGKALRLPVPEDLRRRRLPGAAAVQGVGRQAQRRGRRGHAALADIRVAHRQIKKGLGPVEHKGRTEGRPVGVKKGIAHAQALRRQAQAVVDQGKFPPQLALSRAADVDIQLQKPSALLVGEDAPVLLGPGQTLVRRPQDDQVLDVPAAHTVKVPGGYPVQRYRDAAHVILGEHGDKQPAEGRHVHLHVP